MYKNLGFGILFSILIPCSVSVGHRISNIGSARQLNASVEDHEYTNQTDLPQVLNESSVLNTTESDLFWTIPKTNDTVIADSEIQTEINMVSENDDNTLEIVENDSKNETNDANPLTSNLPESVEGDQTAQENNDNSLNEVIDTAMDDKIVLQRNNCHLEFALHEIQDLKITIKFGKLENNTSGKCYITLNGDKYSKLGVMVSNIHLYQNGSYGEILKVITADYGSDYVLKEYYSWTKHQPLLLTETNKVYVVLYYNVVNVPPREDSYFNLEVITYYKQENHVHQDNYSGSYFPNYGISNIPNSEPFFPPYY